MRLVFVLELGALYLAYCLTMDMPQVSIFNIKTEKVKVEKKNCDHALQKKQTSK